MTAIQLKAELIKLVEKAEDESLLQQALRLFKGTERDDQLRSKLASRASKSAEDIKAGRLYGREEVAQRVRKAFSK